MADKEIPLESGKVYHIYNRGIDGTNLFRNHDNYLLFLKLYAKHCSIVVDTYAYCLLGNHFHFMVRVKEQLPTFGDIYPQYNLEKHKPKSLETLNPNKQFGHFFNAYAQSFNHSFAQKRTGGLLEEPFERILVENEYYFSNLIHYIHFNSEKHGFVRDFKNYPYSSYHSYLSDKPTALVRDEVLEWFGNKSEFVKFHEQEVDESSIKKWIIEVD